MTVRSILDVDVQTASWERFQLLKILWLMLLLPVIGITLAAALASLILAGLHVPCAWLRDRGQAFLRMRIDLRKVRA